MLGKLLNGRDRSWVPVRQHPLMAPPAQKGVRGSLSIPADFGDSSAMQLYAAAGPSSPEQPLLRSTKHD
jgi:hypothetical protein